MQHYSKLFHYRHPTRGKHRILPQSELILASGATPVRPIANLARILFKTHRHTTLGAGSLRWYEALLDAKVESWPKMLSYPEHRQIISKGVFNQLAPRNLFQREKTGAPVQLLLELANVFKV